MLLAYVDESYDRDFYYIAAAIAPQDVWDELESALDQIRARTAEQHGLPADVELHAHEIMGGEGDWRPLRGKHREAAGIYPAALTAARDAGVKYVFRGVDIGRLNARYKYPDQPHGVVFGTSSSESTTTPAAPATLTRSSSSRTRSLPRKSTAGSSRATA